MAIIVQTRDVTEDHPLLADPNTKLWVYNGLDCCVTYHVHNKLAPIVDTPGHAIPYRFVRAMQGAALDMMQRGICVNGLERRKAQDVYVAKKARLQERLDALATAVWGMGLNSASSKQMCAFFYDALGFPVNYAIRKTPEGKVRTPTCDHGALEKMSKLEVLGPGVSPFALDVPLVRLANPIVTLVLALRDCDKKLSVLAQMRERFRCAYSVAGPVTARWSSYANAFGEGSNLQNVTPEMRRPCCADEGKVLIAPDLEQAESRFVAALAWSVTGKDRYWKACESGDLHTVVCTMVWSTTFKQFGAWSDTTGRFEGDLKAARQLAETRWYRHLTFRDGSKRIGHGTNYWGTAYGIAMQIGSVEVPIVSGFQSTYLTAFPEIRAFHTSTIGEVQRTQTLWTPLGRKRTFFGRVTDDSTLREAIAHVPQSSIGELLNYMLYRVWDYGVRGGTLTLPNGQVLPWRYVCELLLQVHDSITVQTPDRPDIVDAVIEKMTSLMDVPVPITCRLTGETRMLRIPLEFKVGYNWAHKDDKRETFADGNPDGLDKYRGPGSHVRKRLTPAKPSAADWLG